LGLPDSEASDGLSLGKHKNHACIFPELEFSTRIVLFFSQTQTIQGVDDEESQTNRSIVLTVKLLSAELVATAADPSGFPSDGLPQVALAGRSNAGKSSLINALCGTKSLARSSQTPGKTQLLNFYRINDAFYLVDLPGFGYAKVDPGTRQRMEALLKDYVAESQELRGVLYLVDPRVPDSPVDARALEWVLSAGRPVLVLAGKADKLGRNDLAKALAEITRRYDLPDPPLPVSAHARTGLDAVWEQVLMLVAG
jgi:GTP-binding protein